MDYFWLFLTDSNTINKTIDASLNLRSKKELIEKFVKSINADSNVREDWQKFVTKQRTADLETIIKEEKLKPEATRKYMANSFRDGEVKTTGTDFDKILPPVSRFGGGREQKKQDIIDKLLRFFEKYFM